MFVYHLFGREYKREFPEVEKFPKGFVRQNFHGVFKEKKKAPQSNTKKEKSLSPVASYSGLAEEQGYNKSV